jgi:hypothetical protein
VIEAVATLAACALAYIAKRGMLTASLCLSWCATAIFAFTLPASLIPGAASIVDVVIAFSALYLWANDGDQRARLVGMLSLVKICIHFGISANFGNGNWLLYAICQNALFVIQCAIAGGAIHGLGRFIDSFSPRRDFGNKRHNRGAR